MAAHRPTKCKARRPPFVLDVEGEATEVKRAAEGAQLGGLATDSRALANHVQGES